MMRSEEMVARMFENPLMHSAGSQSVVRGLQILDALLEEDGPVSATELAAKLGLHQSTVSRVLSAYQAIGFVRKPDYHHFSADVGLAVFAGRAARQVAAVRRALPIVREATCEWPDFGMTLCKLWYGRLVVYLKRDPGGDVHILPSCLAPLHLSVAALREMLEWPREEALACLVRSSEEFGWARPGPDVPDDPAGVYACVRDRLDGDVLRLVNWAGPEEEKAAILIQGPEAAVGTVVLYRQGAVGPHDEIPDALRQLAPRVESALARPDDPAGSVAGTGVHL